jgi:hypothetical protein
MTGRLWWRSRAGPMRVMTAVNAGSGRPKQGELDDPASWVEPEQLGLLDLLPATACAVEQRAGLMLPDLGVIPDVADHLERRTEHELHLVRPAEAVSRGQE